ncbi:MAG: hypothetical protein HYY17_14885 [Planctomycetes bacterium]|nr:hypothetical protein [Planctomycetota bacterium]
MRNAALLALSLTIGCALPRPPAPPATDEVPGLELLRPEARDGIERHLGIRRLEDLPLYDIRQAVDDVTGTFSARMTLRYANLTGRPIEKLPLLLHPNDAADLGSAQPGAGAMAVSSVETLEGPASRWEAARPGMVLVGFGKPVAPGERVTLAVRYSGRFRVLQANANDPYAQGMASLGSLGSVGVADYGLLAKGDGLLTMASAYPMAAPYRDGEFDTGLPARVGDLAYNGVAIFRVRTAVPAGLSIVTNLVDGAPADGPEGTRVTESAGALVRDLVLVAGRDLERASRTVGETRVTSVFRKRDARGGKAALDAATSALASFEKRFGPYPYTELDVVEASLVGGAGGVEFCSMVLIAGMLYRPPEESTSPLATLLKMWGGLAKLLGPSGDSDKPAVSLDPALEFTVAHEVAHQYFAGIVGGDSRRGPALDEPLAQYAAGLAMEDRHGAAAARALMDMNVKLNYALYRLLDGPDRPVLRDAATFRSPIEYAGLVYGKAPYAYVELRKSLGDGRLHGAIREAVARFRFRLVSPREWTEAIGAKAVFRRWFEETHGDEDLGVDDSGDFVLDTIFAPEVAANLRQALPALGMKPKELLRMMFGGGLGDDAPLGPGIDIEKALKALEGK